MNARSSKYLALYTFGVKLYVPRAVLCPFMHSFAACSARIILPPSPPLAASLPSSFFPSAQSMIRISRRRRRLLLLRFRLDGDIFMEHCAVMLP